MKCCSFFFSFGTFSFLYPAYLFYAAFLFMVYKFATCFSNSGATYNKKVLILKLMNGWYLKVSSGKCCYLKISIAYEYLISRLATSMC